MPIRAALSQALPLLSIAGHCRCLARPRIALPSPRGAMPCCAVASLCEAAPCLCSALPCRCLALLISAKRRRAFAARGHALLRFCFAIAFSRCSMLRRSHAIRCHSVASQRQAAQCRCQSVPNHSMLCRSWALTRLAIASHPMNCHRRATPRPALPLRCLANPSIATARRCQAAPSKALPSLILQLPPKSYHGHSPRRSSPSRQGAAHSHR